MYSLSEYSLFDYSQMIAYPARVRAFTDALMRSDVEGSTVCDLGAGFGYFAVLAAKLGARRVFAIEANSVIDAGPELAKANGVEDRIHWIKGMSTEVDLPEKVDILLSDLRASTPFNEPHIPSLEDARERFLIPGGRLLPQRDTLYLALVGSDQLYERLVEPWTGATEGVCLDPIRDRLCREPRRCHSGPQNLMSKPRVWGELDYREPLAGTDYKASLSWQIDTGGTSYGLCLWFHCLIAPGVEISGAPGSPPLPYGQLFLPWSEPLELEVGQWISIQLSVRLLEGEYQWHWQANVETQAPGERYETLVTGTSRGVAAP